MIAATQSGCHGKPLVVLLDLDGTMIGRVTSLLCEYELHKSIAVAAKHDKDPSTRAALAATVPKAVRDSIVARLGWGVIRPHLAKFCASTAASPQGNDAGVELFVYTASEATWASFIVPCVEASLGVRFNRPIFTRQNCVRSATSGGFKKSIRSLLPALVRALKRRYPSVAAPADLRDRVVLVDNTPDIMADPAEASHLVACPTYDYNCNYDVLSHVSVQAMHGGYRLLAPTLEARGLLTPASSSSSHSTQSIDSHQRFAALYYRRLARALDQSLSSNLVALAGDSFFLHLNLALNALIRRSSAGNEAGGLPACLGAAGVAELNRSIRAGIHGTSGTGIRPSHASQQASDRQRPPNQPHRRV